MRNFRQFSSFNIYRMFLCTERGGYQCFYSFPIEAFSLKHARRGWTPSFPIGRASSAIWM